MTKHIYNQSISQSINKSVLKKLYNHKMSLLVVGFSLSLMSCASAPLNAPASSDGRYGVPITERTLAQRLLDQGIERTALLNIYALDDNLKSNSRLSVNSFYSEVLLTGEVPNQQVYDAINKIVPSMPDVKKVYNHIEIRRAKGFSYSLHDGYISSKLNAKILADPYIGYSQIKVVTDDGVVYVMGKLTQNQQEHLRDIMSRTVGIKDFVLLTSIIDDGSTLPLPQESPDDVVVQEQYQPQLPINADDNMQQPNELPDNINNSTSPYIELYKNQVQMTDTQ